MTGINLAKKIERLTSILEEVIRYAHALIISTVYQRLCSVLPFINQHLKRIRVSLFLKVGRGAENFFARKSKSVRVCAGEGEGQEHAFQFHY